MRKRLQLVCAQLETISRHALEEYQDIIRQYIRERNGIYALYRDEKLYYVGLATDLRRRLKQHLKDRHGEAWNRFSIYLTIGDDHLKDLESLLLRIVHPGGNLVKGRFRRCEDLKRRLNRDIKTLQNEERRSIFGTLPAAEAGDKPTKQKDAPVLAIYKNRPRKLRARYKGKLYHASVRRDGRIRVNGKVYNSPSVAAVAVVHRNMNGWWFWQYQRSPGDWVRLRELRQR